MPQLHLLVQFDLHWVLLLFSSASIPWIKNHNKVESDEMEKNLSANVQILIQGILYLHKHVNVPHRSEIPSPDDT